VSSREGTEKVSFNTVLGASISSFNVNETVPQMTIKLRKEIEVTDFKCGFNESVCPELKQYIEATFAARIMTFESVNYWDQVAAYRLVGGFIRTLNEYTREYAAATFVEFNPSTKNLNVMLNCNETSREAVLSHPIPANEVELGIS